MAKYKAKKTADFKEEKKAKKIKPVKDVSESEQEIKNFICILVVIGIIIAGLYFLTKLSNKDESLQSNVNIQYNDISVGMILNRDYEEYYVLVYDFNNSEYSTRVSDYRNNNDTKLFTVNMNDNINSNFVSNNTSNNKATTVEEFMFGETTLLHIKNGQVKEYITGEKNINKIFE